MAPRKYLINYDQNPVTTATIRTNIQTYELMPFDGMIANMTIVDPILGNVTSSNGIWAGSSWDWSLAQAHIADIVATKYNRFKHNFLYIKCTTSSAFQNKPVDWFDPSIQSVVDNWIFCARIAAASEGLYDGLWFDVEPSTTTGDRVFQYSDRPYSSTYTREEYEAQVYQQAVFIMQGIQAAFPNIKLCISFGYEQTTKVGTLPRYDLFGPFLNGLFDAVVAPAEIHQMFEDGYGHYNADQFREDIEDVRQPTTSPRVLADVGTSRYYPALKKGNSIWTDYIDGTHPTFDTGNNLLNYFTAARFQAAIELAFTDSTALGNCVDTYMAVYSQAVKWCTTSPTIPQVYIDAVNDAFVTLGYQQDFTPLLLPNLKGYFDPFSMALADNTAIASYTDPIGAVWIQASGAAQPTFKTTAGLNTHPSVLFTGASSQFLSSDALAAFFTGTDLPYTIIGLFQVAALGVGEAFVTCGGSGANNPVIELDKTTGNVIRGQKVDSAATTVTITSAATLTTSPTILTMVNKGTIGTLRINGNSDPVPGTQDVGLQTLNQFTLGCKRVAANTLFFDGYMGPVLIFNAALGLDQIRYVERGIAAQYGVTLTGG